MTQIEGITVAVGANVQPFKREIGEATALAQGFGRAMTQAFSGAILRGQSFSDLLRTLAQRLSSLALQAAFKPLEQGIGTLFQNLFGGTGGAPPVPVAKHANGGVIARPSYFPLGPSLGLAGERGAEAILPLARGADGKLGVRAEAPAKPISITVNIATPDAASFRRSEAYLSGAIARAVARGERSL